MGERRFNKKKKFDLKEGRAGNAVDPRGMTPKGYVKVWYTPRTFCVDCGQNKLGFTTGLRVMTEPQPSLQLEMLDVIAYWICQQCHLEEHYGGGIVATDDDGDEGDSREIRREKNIIGWVKSAILRGESPTLFDGNMKKVEEPEKWLK